MTDTHETELELAGELRPCTVHYRSDDGVDVVLVTISYTQRMRYTRKGDYEPHDVTHTANVTKLLSPTQINGLVMEITAALQEAMA